MKNIRIEEVRGNNHKRVFEVRADGRWWEFPYAVADPVPTPEDPLDRVYVDPELANMGFTYVLASGREGANVMDHVLSWNDDPEYLNSLLLYLVTVEAQDRFRESGIAHRALARRLRTSPTQIYRLLDQTNYRKSFAQMFALLRVLGCDIEVVVTPKKKKTVKHEA